MIYKNLKIQYPLSRYADTIYYLSIKGDSFKKNIIPDGKTDIVFNLNSKNLGFYKDGIVHYSKDSVIQGLRKKNFQYISNEKVGILGIRLMPFGIYTLLNIPPSKLPEDPVELCLVAGNYVKELEEKIFDAVDIDAKINILLNWLFSLFAKSEEKNGLLIDTIYRIYSTQGKSAINLVCKENYNYYKKVQRSFREAIGISPKLYARMVRFESLHNEILSVRKIDWLDIVTKYNFFDQSHLTKEFQFFTGHTPNEFIHRIESFV